MDQQVTPMCKLCGQPEHDITHGLWHCPAVINKAKHIRAQQREAWQPMDMLCDDGYAKCPYQAEGPKGIDGADMGATKYHNTHTHTHTHTRSDEQQPHSGCWSPGDRWR